MGGGAGSVMAQRPRRSADRAAGPGGNGDVAEKEQPGNRHSAADGQHADPAHVAVVVGGHGGADEGGDQHDPAQAQAAPSAMANQTLSTTVTAPAGGSMVVINR
jgi:hypothetical protein